jgi:xylulokinase
MKHGRKNYILGMDLGTSSCKVCAVDFSGRKLGEKSADYTTFVPQVGWAEQNPGHWIEALSRACRILLDGLSLAPEDVQGVSLSSAAHIAVLLDKNDQPLRNSILWLDQRSQLQADRLAHDLGPEILELSNNWVSSTWTLPHLLWVQEKEPEVWHKVCHVLLSKDYVGFFLTGKRCTDPATAVSSMLYDVARQNWSPRLCSLAKLEPNLLPQVLPVTAQVGTLIPEAAEQFGLKPGIPVINGTLDSTAETFCARASCAGDLVLRLASAGGVHLLLNKAQPHPKLITYPFPLAPLWMVQAGTNSCASAVQWAPKVLAHYKEIPYDQWDALAAKADPGCKGLIFHPYLSGERCPHWDSRLRASFVGLSFQHDLPHFSRAVYEGCAFSIREALAMIDELSIESNDLAIVGGGAKSALWCSIVCDVLGVKVRRAPEVDSSYGAALLGLYGLGVYSDLKEIQSRATFEQEKLSPNQGNHAIYQSLFEVYRGIQQALKPIYHLQISHLWDQTK